MTGEQAEMSGPKAKRSIKNYFLQPLLQVKLGAYCILLSIVFATSVGAILYANFHELIESIVLMTDLEDDVKDLFKDYWKSTQLWVYLVFFLYLSLTILVSVFYTHRLVGPTVAFRRHLRSLAEGRYNARTYLRQGDAFREVADELNHLSETLEKQEASK